jgi:hypothetical protein
VKQNTSGLSTGGKAGIGIGAAAIFLVFLIVAVFWIRGKRHAKDSPEMVEQEQWRRQELDSTGAGDASRSYSDRDGSNDFVARDHRGPNEISGSLHDWRMSYRTEIVIISTLLATSSSRSIRKRTK